MSAADGRSGRELGWSVRAGALLLALAVGAGCATGSGTAARDRGALTSASSSSPDRTVTDPSTAAPALSPAAEDLRARLEDLGVDCGRRAWREVCRPEFSSWDVAAEMDGEPLSRSEVDAVLDGAWPKELLLALADREVTPASLPAAVRGRRLRAEAVGRSVGVVIEERLVEALAAELHLSVSAADLARAFPDGARPVTFVSGTDLVSGGSSVRPASAVAATQRSLMLKLLIERHEAPTSETPSTKANAALRAAVLRAAAAHHVRVTIAGTPADLATWLPPLFA